MSTFVIAEMYLNALNPVKVAGFWHEACRTSVLHGTLNADGYPVVVMGNEDVGADSNAGGGNGSL